MFISLISKIFIKSKPIYLGRWGYHWDKKIKYQVYYD